MLINQQIRSSLIISSIVSILFAVSGCSSVTKGTSQELFVETQDVEDAKCTLASEKGTWTLESTPGYVNVDRGGGSLTVECTKEQYLKSEMLVEEAFEEMTLGNILIGGLVGVVVDAASGAAFKYPPNISIIMRPMLTNLENGATASASIKPTPPKNAPVQTQYPPVQSNKQTVVTLPPTGATVPIADEAVLKKFRGNWKGYAGHGCVDVASSIADVSAIGSVKNDVFRMELNASTIKGATAAPYFGEDRIPVSNSITFEKPFPNTGKAVVTFDKNRGSIFVSLDSSCEIRLKRTRTVAFGKAFKGNRAIDGARVYATNVPVNTPEPITNTVVQLTSSPENGTWVGHGDYGCIYLNSRPATVRMTMLMGSNSSKLTLFQKKNDGTEVPLFSVDAALLPTNLIRLKKPHPDVADVLVSINKSQNLVFAKIGSNCEFQLTQTTPAPRSTTSAIPPSPVAALAVSPAPNQPITARSGKKMFRKFQGNWAGYEGHGCIETGSWPAAVTASAQVKEDIFKLYLEYETTWRKGDYGYQGEGKIPTSHKLVFDKPFSETNQAVVRFNKSDLSIYVILDTTCKIRLKRTNRRTIPADFKGKSPIIKEALLRSQ